MDIQLDQIVEHAGGGRPRIKPELAFAFAYGSKVPSGPIEHILKSLEDCVRRACHELQLKEPGDQAIGRARGDWFEYICDITLRNIPKPMGVAVARLPNVTSLRFEELLIPDQRAMIVEGLQELLRKSDAKLEMSNPDFVCARIEGPLSRVLTEPIRAGNKEDLDRLAKAYQDLRGQLDFRNILFCIGTKTSTRADRRYQLIHEASVVKALVAHLQVRCWYPHHSVRYYVMATDLTDADREVFRTAATHSITDVFAQPVRAIDDVFPVTTVEDIQQAAHEMLSRCNLTA